MNSTDALVDDYLRRLEQAAYALPPERRAELVLEIRDHIAQARASAAGPTDEAWTRTLLDRLGDPAEIVAAAEPGDVDATPGVPAFWERTLCRCVLGLLWLGLLSSIVGALDLPTVTDWVGLGRAAVLLGVLLVWIPSAWSMAAKWSVFVVSAAFLILWPVLLTFPPLETVMVTPGVGEVSYEDPVRWHWQGGFVVAAVLYAGTLLLLWLDLRRARGRVQMRELTALLLIGLGWYFGPLGPLVAMVVAWRSPGLVPWARWVGLAILAPAFAIAWPVIPLGLAQRANPHGWLGLNTPDAWAVTGLCSALLFAWLCFRFFRARIEVAS